MTSFHPIRARLLPLAVVLAGPALAAYGTRSEAALAQQGRALENGDIRSIAVHPPEETRVEHFRLDAVDWDAELPDPDTEPLGLVRFVQGPDVEEPADGPARRLEQEITFFDADTRVIHTERLHPVTRRLVWREVREGSGRTLLVDWALHGGMRSTETVGGAVVRRDHDVSRGAFLPLYLLDLARERQSFDGVFRVFLPLSRTIEDVRLETWTEVGTGGSDRFVLSIRRPDGTSAGRYVFEGDRLVAFQWQRGGPVAREISRNEYDRRTRDTEDEEE